ncbi:hypothetical protein ABK040_011959 [Willaertia magna]
MSNNQEVTIPTENQLKLQWDGFSKLFQEFHERSTIITAQTMISMLGINDTKSTEQRIILDLGCGAGGGSFLIASQMRENDKLICMDLSSKMLELTKERLQPFINNNRQIEFVEGSAESLPFSENSIDIIFSNYVLHLVSNPNTMIQEAFRVLKKEGGLWCSSVWGRPENSPKFTIPRKSLMECNKEKWNLQELDQIQSGNIRSNFHLSDKEELKNRFKEQVNFEKVINWYQMEPLYTLDAKQFALVNIYGNPQLVKLMESKKFTEEHVKDLVEKIESYAKPIMENTPMHTEMLIHVDNRIAVEDLSEALIEFKNKKETIQENTLVEKKSNEFLDNYGLSDMILENVTRNEVNVEVKWTQTSKSLWGCKESYKQCEYQVNGTDKKVFVFVAKASGSPPNSFNTNGYNNSLHCGCVEKNGMTSVFFVIHPKDWAPYQHRFGLLRKEECLPWHPR